jgi:hypothetical protein
MYHVRPMIETSGFAKPAKLPLLMPLTITGAVDYDGPTAPLISGVGGGVDVKISGEKMGAGVLDDLLLDVQICAQACTPIATSPTSLTCRTGEMMTPTTLFLPQFPSPEVTNLGVAAEIVSGKLTDEWKSLSFRAAKQFYDGDISSQPHFSDAEMWAINQKKFFIGLRMDLGQSGMLTSVKIYPPIRNHLRDKLIGAYFQARNISGSWVTLEVKVVTQSGEVVKRTALPERPPAGWNEYELVSPVVAEEFRAVSRESEKGGIAYAHEIQFVGYVVAPSELWSGVCQISIDKLTHVEADGPASMALPNAATGIDFTTVSGPIFKGYASRTVTAPYGTDVVYRVFIDGPSGTPVNLDIAVAYIGYGKLEAFGYAMTLQALRIRLCLPRTPRPSKRRSLSQASMTLCSSRDSK